MAKEEMTNPTVAITAPTTTMLRCGNLSASHPVNIARNSNDKLALVIVSKISRGKMRVSRP